MAIVILTISMGVILHLNCEVYEMECPENGEFCILPPIPFFIWHTYLLIVVLPGNVTVKFINQ